MNMNCCFECFHSEFQLFSSDDVCEKAISPPKKKNFNATVGILRKVDNNPKMIANNLSSITQNMPGVFAHMVEIVYH